MQTRVQIGEVIAGKYCVERVIGEGGMGVVVVAHHVQLNERFALKFLVPDALHNPEAVARFAREARAAVKLKNEHVARVVDVGTLETGAPFMVMEYLEGLDLEAWIAQRGRMEVGQAVDFVLQASVAIAEAHSLGIVHRDLKPANLFCVRRYDGQLGIKVLDFGISKMVDPNTGDANLTRTTSLMGSPSYMSPEQMRSAKLVDERTDIWSLGVVLYEILAGTGPFASDTLMALGAKIATAPPTPMESYRTDVPEPLLAVIVRCLEKDAALRFQTVGEFAAALEPFAPEHAKGSVGRISGILASSGSRRVVQPPAATHQTRGKIALQKTLEATVAASKADVTLGPRGWPVRVGLLLSAALLAGALSFVLVSRARVAAAGAVVGSTIAIPSAGTEPATTAAATSQASAGAAPAPPATAVAPSDPPPERPAEPSVPTTRVPRAAPTHAKVATSCVETVITEYDSEGNPHFKKVCK